MTVDTGRNELTRMPPLPELVQVTARSTDEGLIFVSDDRGQIRIHGCVRDQESSNAEALLSFDGRTVVVGLDPGATADRVVHLLHCALPAGYRLTDPVIRGDELIVQLVRRPGPLLAVGAEDRAPHPSAGSTAATDAFAR